jgi:hypothetical protein
MGQAGTAADPDRHRADNLHCVQVVRRHLPETIDIAEVLGSLHWRGLAAGDPDMQRRFAAEIGRRLGQPDYQPQITGDAIAH